jgi:type II secretory pathway pseudopilin PulG
MTLVELLVVVVIITTLVATAIPILNPTTDNRRMREASRAVNGFISAAQTRATQIGRPFGVALKRLSQDTGNPEDRAKCLELYYVEQPAPFAGFDDASFVRLSRSGRSSGVNAWSNGGMIVQFVRRVSPDGNLNDFLPAGLDRDSIPPGLFRQGDTIRIDGKVYQFTDATTDLDASGFYRSTSGDPDGELYVRLLDSNGSDPNYHDIDLDPNRSNPSSEPYLVWTEPLTYSVIRQPTPTSLSPLQLPPGTAIDLQASGLLGVSAFYVPWSSNTEAFIDNDQPVVIMFAPEGPVSRINLSQQLGSRTNPSSSTIEQMASGQIALLIGRGDTPPAVTVGPINDQIDLKDWSTNSQEQMKKVRADYNWLSGDARWVVVGASTGAVATVENALVDPTKWQNYDRNNSGDVPFAEQIWAATEFVRQSSRVGGR